MKKIYWVAAVAVLLLSACGGAPSGKPDNNESNKESNKTDYLYGGPIDAPTSLQFDKPYYFGNDLPKSYVKFTVKKFQRISFDRHTNGNYYQYENTAILLYDNNMNKLDLYAQGDAWDTGSGNNSGTLDYIFLKAGTYVARYYFYIEVYHDTTAGIITARNLGTAQFPKIQNKGTYNGTKEEHKFYALKSEKDRDVNFKGELDNYGDSRTFSAILYDNDLNIIQNFDNVRDVNVTLSQGDYLFHPINRPCTITFLNP